MSMTTHEHLAAAGCPDSDCVTNAAAIDGLPIDQRGAIVALIAAFGRKALPIILKHLPEILAGNYVQAITEIIAELAAMQPAS